MPDSSTPTDFRQDVVKWPFVAETIALSTLIVLQDTTVEMGCMSLMSGSYKLMDVRDIATLDQDGWKKKVPDLQ